MWPPRLSQVLVMVLLGSILLTGTFIVLSQAGGYGSNQRTTRAMHSPTPTQLKEKSHGTAVPGYTAEETPAHKTPVAEVLAVSTPTTTGTTESQMEAPVAASTMISKSNDPAPVAESNDQPAGELMVPTFMREVGWFDVNPRLSSGPGKPQPSVHRSLFEQSMFVGLYGAPGICQMGILGCIQLNEIESQIEPLVRQYQKLAGESIRVNGAIHYVVDIAHEEPGPTGEYVKYDDLETIKTYADYAKKHSLLLFLDLQIGWGEVDQQILRFSDLLAEPHVHIALDPEWATKYSGVPPGGDYIGRLTAEEIDQVQLVLADIVIKHDIPRKILIVHQFLSIMIPDEKFKPVPEVDLVIDCDGWGPPQAKLADYSQFSLGPHSEFPGIKLFFEWDTPLLTPIDLMRLSYPPKYVVYQ
ncbi:MAG: hypothetical protein VYD09_04320 [Chloroflexota bacterium]|nr:hypothetical protein [Chloroflexota bacterium]